MDGLHFTLSVLADPMSDETPKDVLLAEAFEKLEKTLRENKSQKLTDDQFGVLVEFLKFLLALKSLGSLGGILYRVAGWCLMFIGIWFALKAGAIDFIREVMADK